MKPSLQLKLSQHLALTPQLQQSIRLLQLSTLELEQELEKYLQENPLLEREEVEYAPQQTGVSEADSADTEKFEPDAATPPASSADDESWLGEESSYSSSPGSFDDDDNDYQDIQAAGTTLRDRLHASFTDDQILSLIHI